MSEAKKQNDPQTAFCTQCLTFSRYALFINRSMSKFMGVNNRQKGLVLCALMEAEGRVESDAGLTVKEVAERVQISASAANDHLRDLEAMRLVVRIEGAGRVADTYYVDHATCTEWMETEEGQAFEKELSLEIAQAVVGLLPGRQFNGFVKHLEELRNN